MKKNVPSGSSLDSMVTLKVAKKNESWALLSLLKPAKYQVWYVVEDFNKIISQYEKRGGSQNSRNPKGRF